MSNREDLRKKLREKLREKKMFRNSKEQKETFVDNELKKAGIDDIEKFKEQIKNLNPNFLKEELKKLNISI
jgi:hypothetical protein